MALKKAAIIIDKGKKGKSTVEVLFNPSSYSIDDGNEFSWKKITGLSYPVAQFISGQKRTLTMDLFFDSYAEKRDVRTYTHKITSLLKVEKDLHVPPLCTFVWGKMKFKGVVETVKQEFTMFLSSGTPVRAKLAITFAATEKVTEQIEEIPRQSADRTKQVVLTQGEQLWQLADREYEDPTNWRPIAEANGIDNPRKLKAGQKLIIPRLD